MNLLDSYSYNNSRNLVLVLVHIFSESRCELAVHVVVTCAAFKYRVKCVILYAERHALFLGCCKFDSDNRLSSIFIVVNEAL